MSISRRKFIQGTAAGIGVASTLNANELFSEVKKIPHANNFGPFYALVQDGVIKDILPHEMDKRPGYFTKAHIDRVYSNSRIKYPCVRKSYLENKKDNHKLRGKEEFVRVSWDKALKLAADKIKATKKENIYNASYSNWGHPGSFNSCAALSGRFFNNAKRGAIGTAGEYSNGAAGAVNVDIMGDLEVYSLQTAHEQMLANTKVYVMWGADLFKCNKIDFMIANRENDLYFPKYKNSGMQFISIDPIYTETAQMFNARWIKIRPNTDVALMLAMMYYLVESKKYNKEFVEKYTYGFDKFLPYLLGKTDNTPKTPAWASKITEIEEKVIKELADIFVSNRTFIAGNWAMQRADHGEQADWTLITLASLIGQIGLPGGGIGFSMHYSGGGQAAAVVQLPGGLSQGRNRVKTIIPASRISEAILNPGKKFTYKGKARVFPKIDVMFICGANIVGHHPNLNELIKALRTLDTFIVQEPWWTPTAKMADIVFPACTTLERDDMSWGGSYSMNGIFAMKKAIEPLYESKPDYEIFAELIKHFGEKAYKKFTDEKHSLIEHIKEAYNGSGLNETLEFDKFWEKGYLEIPREKEAFSFVRHADFRKDPINYKLATASGKIQIYMDKYEKLNYSDFKAHPTWFEPFEYLGANLAKKYSFHLVSPHPSYRIHSQLDNTWLKSYYKVQGREPVLINTNDAKKLGIKHHDLVEIYNDRGRVLAGAFVTDNIRSGVLALQEGAWYSPENPQVANSRCNSGQANVLTSSKPTSMMAQATTANTTLVNIKLAQGEISPNQAYNPPKIIQG